MRNQKLQSSRNDFSSNWTGSQSASQAVRRRVMAALRKACAVLMTGKKSRIGRLGGGAVIGALLMGIATPAMAQNASGGTTVGTSGTTTATGTGAVAVGGGTGQTATANGDAAIAIGANSSGQEINSIAVGNTAVAYADGIALGAGATADQSVSTNGASGGVAIGSAASTSNASTYGIAIGASSTVATGVFGTAVGTATNVSADGASAFGSWSVASAANATAIGAGTSVATGATASGAGATAIGSNATAGALAQSANSIAIGGQSLVSTTATNAMAIGSGAQATGLRNIAIGFGAVAGGVNDDIVIGRDAGIGTLAANGSGNSVSIGTRAGQNVTGILNVAIGNTTGNFVVGQRNTAIGSGAGSQVTGGNNAAFGWRAGNRVSGTEITVDTSALAALSPGIPPSVTGTFNVSQGTLAGNFVTGVNNVSAGLLAGSVVTGNNNVSSGYHAGYQVTGDNNIAIGLNSGNTITASNAVAIGNAAAASKDDSIAIGTGAIASGTQAISIGTGNVVSGDNSGAFGDPNTVSGSGSYAFGNNNNIAGNAAVAIGLNNNVAQNNTFVLGHRVVTTQANSVVLGADSTDRAPSTGATAQSIVVNGVTRTYAGPASAANGIISVGAVGRERQILNVAAGDVSASSTDAINGSQLAAVASGLTHYYSVNDGGVVGGNFDNDGATGLNALAAGVGASASEVSGVAIGNGAEASGIRAIAMGENVDSDGEDSIAIGTDAETGASGAIALGLNSAANSTQSIAIGQGATASNANSVALGSGAQTDAAVGTSTAATSTGIAYPVVGSFAGNAPTGTVSIGVAGSERTLTNVAAGRISSTSTDGINGSQLYAVAELAGKGINLTTGQTGTGVANGAAVSTVAPGDTVQVTAGNNIITTQVGKEVQVAVNPVLTGITSLAITNGPTLSSTGINMGNTSITNLTAGVNPTDAVNVSQLTTAIGTVAINFTGNSGGTFARTNGQTLAINGVGSTGGTYSGANLKTVADPATGAINIQMTDAPVFTSVTTGNTTINNAGLTIVGGPSVTNLGINAANTVITNVAPGVNGTDGVNVNQLTTVSGVANRGFDLTTGATGSGVALGTTLETVTPGEQVTYQAGNNMIVSQTGNTVNYALNPVVTGLTSVSITGGPTIDSTGIHNLAAGVNPTDAVNVSQLTSAIGSVAISFSGNSGGVISRNNGQTLAIQGAATTAGTFSGDNVRTVTDPATGAVNIQIADAPRFGTVTINDGGTGRISGVAPATISATSQDAVNGSQLFALGTSIATGLGGGSVYNTATGAVTTSLAVGGNTYTTVQDALQAVNTAVNAGFNVTTSAVGTGTVSGSSVQNIAPGTTATFTAGNNIAITQVGSEVQVAVNPNMSADSVTVTGGPTIDNRGISLSAGDTLNMGGNAITNMAAGVNGTDGVNVSQLNAGLDNVINTANAYTDQRLNALNFDLSKFKRDANAGTAAAMAMAAVPQAFEPGMGIVGGGVSTWMGQQAIAVGFSKASDNGRVIIKATGTINSRGKGGAAAGVGFQF